MISADPGPGTGNLLPGPCGVRSGSAQAPAAPWPMAHAAPPFEEWC